jgi:hypothetical protein
LWGKGELKVASLFLGVPTNSATSIRSASSIRSRVCREPRHEWGVPLTKRYHDSCPIFCQLWFTNNRHRVGRVS